MPSGLGRSAAVHTGQIAGLCDFPNDKQRSLVEIHVNGNALETPDPSCEPRAGPRLIPGIVMRPRLGIPPSGTPFHPGPGPPREILPVYETCPYRSCGSGLPEASSMTLTISSRYASRAHPTRCRI